ncbi:MAG: ABC transporter ATP-binding protein [Kiritimatiellaeota bacterium]|nr:ABC transporter ATP-binding protein [Kiritimatiellota bacterium]
MSHHIVEVDNVFFKYPDGTSALRGVDLEITHGESVALIGENGAGKSTLLMQFNGSLLPTSGEVRIGHALVRGKTLPEIRRTVGMVFQNSDDQLFMPTVEDDVGFGPFNLGFSGEEVARKVDLALEDVGLPELKRRSPHHLSGGEKKRIAIATVLSMDPKILVMDEPTLGLDPKSRRSLIGLLKSFSHTKILASHDLDMVAEVCDRVVVIFDGVIEADGPVGKILGDEALLKRCSLEPPSGMRNCPFCGGVKS